MSSEKVTLVILALAFLGLVFLNPASLRKTGDFLTFGLSGADKISTEELMKKIAEEKISPNETKNNFVTGDVFSRYPLNLKDELLVDVGQGEGVKLGGAALWSGILVGKVKAFEGSASVVQTILDPNFSLSVRVGKSRTDTLLRGGVEPKVTMIPKDSKVQPGDAVYSASADFEYGLPLGAVGPVSVNSQNVFSEADLVLSYSPADLRYLLLEKK